LKLLETYANQVGIKLPEKPSQLAGSYFPTPDKYITIHVSSGMESKNYDLYQDVVDILHPILSKLDIKIVQIGGAKDQKISHCVDLCGKTNLNHCAYIISGSLLHLGNDSVWSHVAGSYDIPEVILFGPTLANVCSPYYFNSKSIFLESDRKGNRATHSSIEPEKTINLIKPEDVAHATLSILGVSGEYQTVKTLFVGNKYHSKIIEVIPDHIIDPDSFPGIPLNFRLDYFFNESIFIQNLTYNENVVLVTDQPMDLNPLRENLELRDRLKLVICEVNSLAMKKFILDLHSLGINYNLISQESGDSLSKLRAGLFDFRFIVEKEKVDQANKDIIISSLEGESPLFVKTNKMLLSKGSVYLSRFHFDKELKSEKPRDEFEIPKEYETLLEELDYFYVYERDTRSI